MWFVTLGIGFFALGGLPPAHDFRRDPFVEDAQTLAARAVLAQIPADPSVSVQAPDALLPHLAERYRVHRAPPPDFGTDYVVLDVSHRQRYAKQEDLLRTLEEPVVRDFMARDDYALLFYAPPYALFKRGESAREASLVKRFFMLPEATENAAEVRADNPRPLTDCLSLLGGEIVENTLRLYLFAHGPCPPDLALYLGPTPTPARADLFFDGLLSPAQLRAGDRLLSEHSLSLRERAAYRDGLFVSVLRENGARPSELDPSAVPLHFGPEAADEPAATPESAPAPQQ